MRGKYGEKEGGGKPMQKLGHLGSSSFSFVVRTGESVKFWKDRWCGATPLYLTFPTLFAIVSSKEIWRDRRREWGMGDVGILCFLDTLMIGCWKRLKDFWHGLGRRK